MKTKLEIFAELIEMPAEHVREAADAIIRRKQLHERILEKVRIIRSGNTAILPTGEIVERGTPGVMDYESPPDLQEEKESECGYCIGSGKMLDPLDYRRDVSCRECNGSGRGKE